TPPCTPPLPYTTLFPSRFTYFPSIGIAVAIAWSIPASFAGGEARRGILALAGASVIVVLVASSFSQSLIWHDSYALFGRALELRSEEHTSELQSPCNLV